MVETLIICLVVFICTLWKSEVGLALSINSYLLNSALHPPDYKAKVLTETDSYISVIIPLIVFSVIVFRSIINRKSRDISKPRNWFSTVDVILLLIGWVLLAGGLYSPLQEKALLVGGKYFALGVSFYFIARLCFSNHRSYQKAIQNMLITVWATSLVLGLFAVIRSWGMIYARLTLGTAHPIPFSLLVSIGVVINFNWLMRHSSKKLKLFQLGSFIVLLYILIETNTRGTLVAAGVAITYLLFVYVVYNRGLGKVLLAIPLLFAGIYAVNAYNPDHFQKVSANLQLITSSDQGESIDGRKEAFKVALYLLNNHPLIGVGTGGFESFAKLLYPHNVFLEMLSENGTLGTMSLVLLFLSIITLIWKITKYKNTTANVICAIVLLNMVEMQFSFTLWMHKIFFLFCGVLVALYHNSKKNTAERTYLLPNKPQVLIK